MVKRILIIIFRLLEVLVVSASVIICIGYHLSGHDNLEFGIERITGITGYELNQSRAELILHKSNNCDSIVMIHDFRSTEIISSQMETLVAKDDRWKKVQIPECEAYNTIERDFAGSMQTNEHFRPVCEISNGYYDYEFLDIKTDHTSHIDRYGCLVDVDTGTIALYIYLD